MNLKPLNDRVIVKPLKDDEKTKSGIILPDTADKKRQKIGEVTAVGDGRLLDNGSKAPVSIKVGDRVVFDKYYSDDDLIDKTFLILDERDILAIIE